MHAGAPVVLAVDDDDCVRRLYRRMVERHLRGYFVGVGSAAELWRRLTTLDCPDLVLLDYHLPDADGRAIWEELCDRVPVYREIPLILLSSEGALLAGEAYWQQTAACVVPKPFDVQQLLVQLRRWLP